MSKQNYQAFASSFLDLWQDQLTRAMSDTDFLQTLMDNMQHMQAGLYPHEHATAQTHQQPAAASESDTDQLDALKQRLAAAERKITKLEAKLERIKPPVTKQASAAASAAAKPVAKPATNPTAKRTATQKPAKAAAKSTARKRAVKRS